MSNDLFGGLMKGISAFVPKDDPNMKVFQSQSEMNDLQSREAELYAEIGKKAYPSICEKPEYNDLVTELKFTQKKMTAAQEELQMAQNTKTEQEKKNQELLQSRTCPNCGTLNPEGIKFCQECGAQLNLSGKVVCPGCGAEFSPGTKFCGECGKPL